MAAQPVHFTVSASAFGLRTSSWAAKQEPRSQSLWCGTSPNINTPGQAPGVSPGFGFCIQATQEDTKPVSIQRHKEYYFDDGNVVIQVENTLYRLHRSLLEKHSPVFREMWSVPQPEGTTEGKIDETPIVLGGIKDVDFLRFLWVLYPSVLGACKVTTVEEWLSVMDQADRWQIDSLRFSAVTQLKKLEIDPVSQISIWNHYNLDRNDLVESYAALILRPQSLTLKEAQVVGLDTVVRIAAARDRAHEQGLYTKILPYNVFAGVNPTVLPFPRYASPAPAALAPSDSHVIQIVREIFEVATFSRFS